MLQQSGLKPSGLQSSGRKGMIGALASRCHSPFVHTLLAAVPARCRWCAEVRLCWMVPGLPLVGGTLRGDGFERRVCSFRLRGLAA